VPRCFSRQILERAPVGAVDARRGRAAHWTGSRPRRGGAVEDDAAAFDGDVIQAEGAGIGQRARGSGSRV